MLTVTPVASTAIGLLATACRIAETGGLRVTVLGEVGDRSTIALSVAGRPAEGDEVMECGAEARVFLDPDAAIQLAGHILDAHQDSAAAFHFSLRSKDIAHGNRS
ncbi:MAG: hypothetical protein ABIQ18_44475 [Umezawaea sp.]